MKLVLSENKKVNITVFVIAFILYVLGRTNELLLLGGIYAFTLTLSIKNNKQTLYGFLYIVLIQNILMVLLAPYIFRGTTTLFCLAKEIMIYFSFGIAYLLELRCRDWKLSKQNKYNLRLCALLAIFILISFVRSSVTFGSKVVAIRTILLPFVCFLFGYYLRIQKSDVEQIIIHLAKLTVIIVILGAVDLFVFKDRLLLYLPLKEYYVNKGTPNVFSWTGLPTNYTTWDFVSITEGVLYRLVSILTDPLLIGHFSFGVLVLLDAVNKRNKKLYQLVLLVGSLLTLSKGIYISVIIWILLKIVCKFSLKNLKKVILLAFAVFIICAVLIPVLISKYLPGSIIATSSMMSHLNGLTNGFLNASLFGKNLGKAGSVAYMLQEGNGGNIDVEVVENWMGAYVYQLGYVALSVFIIFWGKRIVGLADSYISNKDKLSFSALVILLAVIIESFMSESAFSIVGTGFYFIFAGIIYRMNYIVTRKERCLTE